MSSRPQGAPYSSSPDQRERLRQPQIVLKKLSPIGRRDRFRQALTEGSRLGALAEWGPGALGGMTKLPPGEITPDYLKSVIPSQLIAERGSNLVVINPGSANVRIGLAHQKVPYNIPHCIARFVKSGQKNFVQDQMLNTRATPAQSMERENAYNTVASFLKIPLLDEEFANNSFPRKMGRVDGYTPYQSRNDFIFTWTNVMDAKSTSNIRRDGNATELHSLEPSKSFGGEDSDSEEYTFKEFICGEDALRISPSEPYCLSRPIRRGHFNISQDYPLHQVIADLCSIWDWILVDKLHILVADRNSYSVVLVLPESFDNREIKEMLSIVLRDLRFSTAVVHQEGLAAAFGNGLSTACVVNIGAQVTSVICIEDGVALPSTIITLPYGGEDLASGKTIGGVHESGSVYVMNNCQVLSTQKDISRCLLWVQRRHLTWPILHTDPMMKPIDMLMLNRIKESYCQIREGEFDAVAIVHSYEEGKPIGSHKARLAALNVPDFQLLEPNALPPDCHYLPPRQLFSVSENGWEKMWRMKRYNISLSYFILNSGLWIWRRAPLTSTMVKKDELVGLAEAVISTILMVEGRVSLRELLVPSIRQILGAASSSGVVSVVSLGRLHSMPASESPSTSAYWISDTNPTFRSWRLGGVRETLDRTQRTDSSRTSWREVGLHIIDERKREESPIHNVGLKRGRKTINAIQMA
ncbi:Actin-related protein 9 [Platanthera guangdongensis]|uniref:Actin-related protein 9 n=1 Tax=Platanthera guangdongensis TaxID=2320717 RepID=A0ABR2LS91_9ASPA